jgi:hypothetical protein
VLASDDDVDFTVHKNRLAVLHLRRADCHKSLLLEF